MSNVSYPDNLNPTAIGGTTIKKARCFVKCAWLALSGEPFESVWAILTFQNRTPLDIRRNRPTAPTLKMKKPVFTVFTFHFVPPKRPLNHLIFFGSVTIIYLGSKKEPLPQKRLLSAKEKVIQERTILHFFGRFHGPPTPFI